MIIRPATLEDSPAIVAMGLAFLKATSYSSFLTADTPERLAWMVGVCLEHGIGLVAEEGDELLGMIGFIIAPNELSGELVATELAWWTNISARRSSAGPRLLEAGEDEARKRGATSVRMIAPNSTELHTHYSRRGYVPVETSYLKRLEDGRTHDDTRAHRNRRSRRSGSVGEDRTGQGEESG